MLENFAVEVFQIRIASCISSHTDMIVFSQQIKLKVWNDAGLPYML